MQHGDTVLIPCVSSFFELSPIEIDCLMIYGQEDIIWHHFFVDY